jgi:hypothetical protein
MKCHIEITGVSPLLMHRFDEKNLSSPTKNKNLTPEQIADKFAYKTEEGELYVPMECMYSCLINGGKFSKLGKNKITTMRSSMVPAGINMVNKICLLGTKEFSVDSRAAVNPSTGGRVMVHRPRLEEWKLSFTLDVDTNLFPESAVRTVVDDAGIRIGLLSFRPERKGYFGKFIVTKWECEM